MVTALGADLPPMTLLVSTDTVVTDVLARVVDKHPIPGITADDLVLVEEEVWMMESYRVSKVDVAGVMY